MRKLRMKLLFIFSAMFLILAGVLGAYSIFKTVAGHKKQLLTYEETLISQYDLRIVSEVETAYSLMNDVYEKYQSGELTEKEAKEKAINDIKALRYGDSGYFWIDDTEGILIAHPMLPEQEGDNRINIQDPNGVYLIQNIIKAATTGENNGFTVYEWEKPGVDHLVTKRAYSKLFEPWNYIISTGNYIDDIEAKIDEKKQELNKEMRQDIVVQLVIVFILLFITGFIAYIFSNNVGRQISQIAQHVQKVADNNLSVGKLTISAKDEIGQLSAATNQMVENLRSIIQDLVSASEKLKNSSSNLTKTANEVKYSSNQIAATMQQLSSGSETQASSASELATAMSSFNVTINKTNELSKDITQLSSEVEKLAMEGSQLMSTSISQMSAVDQIVQNAVMKMQELDKQTQEISNIVNVVNAIAEQTNLLALNAAIEAARAGEHGKGFAVVAEEVRKLAEQVSASVSEITDILYTIRSESSEVVSSLQDGYAEVAKGTEQIKTTGTKFKNIHEAISNMISQIHMITESLSQITENSSNMNRSIDNIAATSKQSAVGIEQTAVSIQQNSSSMEEIADNAQQLSRLADHLNQIVHKFQI